MKLSTFFWLLTALCVLITVTALVFFFRSDGQLSTVLVMAPAVAALLCSSLAVRARNEGK